VTIALLADSMLNSLRWAIAFLIDAIFFGEEPGFGDLGIKIIFLWGKLLNRLPGTAYHCKAAPVVGMLPFDVAEFL
jgi:hypothetical protein